MLQHYRERISASLVMMPAAVIVTTIVARIVVELVVGRIMGRL